MPQIKLFDVRWETNEAGISPHNNMRTELYFKGCNKALSGDPCPGCFNQPLWDDSAEITHTPESIVAKIKEYAPNKFVTIVGGEPTDQMDGLIELTRLLKENNFHIIVFTWKDLKAIFNGPETKERYDYIELISNIDIIVDGPYDENERLFNPKKNDGVFNSIGSGNQTIWDIRSYLKNPRNKYLIGHKLRHIYSMHMDIHNDLYVKTNKCNHYELIIEKQKGAIIDGQKSRQIY